MILAAFRKALLAALKQHFPHSKISVEERRGLILACKAELNDETFIAVYFNALTGKTSYALVQRGQRVAEYDNYKFWHYHPLAATAQHVPCAEPTPEDALAELALVSAKTISGGRLQRVTPNKKQLQQSQHRTCWPIAGEQHSATRCWAEILIIPCI